MAVVRAFSTLHVLVSKREASNIFNRTRTRFQERDVGCWSRTLVTNVGHERWCEEVAAQVGSEVGSEVGPEVGPEVAAEVGPEVAPEVGGFLV